jgi:glycosyltransferase involved in cell wall biosynthesis
MIDSEKILVSVIIPIYNTENYLRECLESVLKQTMTDIELICVNDGSTDNCPAILDEYASNDKRVKVIHKTNGGYGNAVNVGLDKSVGKYISIIEPDDYVEKEMLESLFKICEEHSLDMISSNHKRFKGSAEERVFTLFSITNNKELYNVLLNPYNDRRIFEGNFINPASMFNRRFLTHNGIRHNETPGASYQDLGFCFQTLGYARRIMLIEEAFYCYRQDNPNSSINSKGKIKCVIDEYQFILNKMKENWSQLGTFLPEFNRRKVGSYLYTYNRIAIELRREFLLLIRKDFRDSLDRKEMDVTRLTGGQKIQIRIIMENPEELLKREEILRDEIHLMIEKIPRVFIYGAGAFGKQIYDVMYDDDRLKVEGFAVTDCRDNIHEYKNIPVRHIDTYDRGTPVIVGVTEKFRDEICEILRHKGWSSIICLEQGMLF